MSLLLPSKKLAYRENNRKLKIKILHFAKLSLFLKSRNSNWYKGSLANAQVTPGHCFTLYQGLRLPQEQVNVNVQVFYFVTIKFKPMIKAKNTQFYMLAVLPMIMFASCSKSPEKAIEAMKKKADDYMVSGRKPTEEMIIADCSDLFAKNFKDDIGWTSKLRVFEPILLDHIDKKELFDNTRKFPTTRISAETFKSDNGDSAYFYLHTEATIDDVVFINDKGAPTVRFVVNDNGKYRQVPNLFMTVDIPKSELDKQKIIGCPFASHDGIQPYDYYFYDPKTNQFDGTPSFIGANELGKALFKAIIVQSKNDTTTKEIVLDNGQILSNHCSTLYFRIANENGAGLIDDEKAKEQINEVFSDDEYLVWEKSEDKQNAEPIGDRLTLSGIFELSAIKNCKILKKEPGFNLNSLKKVNFRTGKML